jgi:hypothetical protein
MTKTLEISDETYEKIKSQLTQDEAREIKNLDELVGETYCFQCARYIYHGKVKTVNSDYIELEKAGVVFETGDYSNTSPSDRQALPHNVFVMRGSIESFYKMNW